MNYADWIKTVPKEFQDDALWNQEAYRLALFAADVGWIDTTKLFRDGRTLKLAAQLYDAIGSIGANISEGYSRGFQKDRARFYEYALGSARESRTMAATYSAMRSSSTESGFILKSRAFCSQ